MIATMALFALSFGLATAGAELRARRTSVQFSYGVAYFAPLMCAASVSAAASVLAPQAATAIAIASAVCAVSCWTDLACGLVFDVITYPAMAVLVAVALIAGDAPLRLISALCSAGCLAALHLLTRGRGLGLGDVKLAAVMGLACVPLSSLIGLGAAFVGGAVICLLLVAFGRLQRDAAVPFAPFLAGGAAVAFLVGVPHL